MASPYRYIVHFLTFVTCLFLLLGCGGGSPSASASITYDPSRLIVKLSPSAALSRTASIESIVQEYNVTAIHGEPASEYLLAHGIYVIDTATRSNTSIEQKIQQITSDNRIDWVERIIDRTLCISPTDESYPREWHLEKIGVEVAWNQATGKDVIVAILDTGIDPNHVEWENITDKIVKPNSFVSDDVLDVRGHGSHCAGIVASPMNNGGIVGVAPNASIMPVKIFSDDPNGKATSANIAAGIYYAVDNGADVISMSFGSYGISRAEEEACEYAIAHNVILVAAAGNNNTDKYHYPSAYPGVINVAATDKDDMKATSSNYGANIVDIAAPGVNIYSTIPNGYQYKSGTSMACPQVAGACALLKQLHPSWTPAQIEERLYAACDKIGEEGILWRAGRLNVSKLFDNTQLPNSPIITSISPSSGSTSGNTSVIISGMHFGDLQGTGRITFDGILASSYISWSDTKVVCINPAHIVGEANVSLITNNGNSVTSEMSFTYEDLLKTPLLFSDTEFVTSDWNMTKYLVGTGSIDVTMTFHLEGGYPGGYMEVLTSVGGYAGDKQALGYFIKTNAEYSPQAQGAISTINYKADSRYLAGFHGSGQSTGPALMQNGHYYISLGLVTGLSQEWHHLTKNNLTASDFICITDGVSPDFTAQGSSIRFGFFCYNTNSGWANTNIHSAGIDNWSVELVR